MTSNPNTTNMATNLLTGTDPAPVEIRNPEGASPVLITCEHAGKAIPALLGDMGLALEDRTRHIAWDIGAEATALRLAELLDAPLVLQRYSRLVVDCNRPASSPDSIPPVSDGTAIPANADLDKDARAARHEEILEPYHEAITALLDARQPAKRTRALLSLHSFNPSLHTDPTPRPWDLGLLCNRDKWLGERLYKALEGLDLPYVMAYNEPYSISDMSDYTIPVHGEARGLPSILLEIRNDRIEDQVGALAVAGHLAQALAAIRDL